MGAGAAAEALAQHHLEDVAGGDVLLGLAHPRLVLVAANVRLQPVAVAVGGPPATGGHGRQWPQQLLSQPVDAPQGVDVGRLGVVFHDGVGQQDEPVAGVVEDDERIGQQEDGVGHVRPRRGRLRQPLEEAHHVIAQIADRAAGKARQPRRGGQLVAAEFGLEDGQDVFAVGQFIRSRGAGERGSRGGFFLSSAPRPPGPPASLHRPPPQ